MVGLQLLCVSFFSSSCSKGLDNSLSSTAISTTTTMTTTTTISSSLLHRLMIKMTLHLIQYDCDIICGTGTGMGYYSSKTSTRHRIMR
mmetsp:Transcript_31849/g.35481  ORF Transcript_31849/g.35481 Transcript_31849/m.35481 type:complete len:88 (+) Transcript_31849:520-783(+)